MWKFFIWALLENPTKASLYKTTTDSLKDLPRKVAMVRGTLDFAKRSIVSYSSFNDSNMLPQKPAMECAKDAQKELWISAKRSCGYEGNVGQRPYKATTAGLGGGLPRKVGRDGAHERNFGFRERSIDMLPPKRAMVCGVHACVHLSGI